MKLPKDLLAEAERLLGGSGRTAAMRLDLDRGATPAEVRDAAVETLNKWRRRAENPVSVRAVVDAARVVVRSCEGIIADLPQG